MKKIVTLTLCLAALLILTACTFNSKESSKNVIVSPSSKNISGTGQDAKEITVDDLVNTLTDEEKCWMNLSSQQYLDDFDTLYKELQDNYPYFGILRRKHGIDLDAIYNLYRPQIIACKNDYDFWKLLQSFISELKYTGHIETWGTRYSFEVESLQSFILDYPEYKESMTPYLKKLDNPVSKANYQSMKQFYSKMQQKADNMNSGIEPSSDNTFDTMIESEAEKNVTTDILEEGAIAYVKINAFDMDTYKGDKALLYSFYKKVNNYSHLIIDISENGGGGMDYFNNLVVAPLANQIYEVTCLLLAKDGENNKYFLNIPQGLKEGNWKPISNLPALPHLNQDDLSELNYFMEETYKVEPNSNGFKGRIWLLVSPNNYSSSEYSAMFSKQSGFATLVGERTGGDGIGVDPAYIILPNSGIVIQYSPIYGITRDGRNSEEFGTEPDYNMKEGEKPLDACLRVIKES
jgi:hypothetical protein